MTVAYGIFVPLHSSGLYNVVYFVFNLQQPKYELQQRQFELDTCQENKSFHNYTLINLCVPVW